MKGGGKVLIKEGILIHGFMWLKLQQKHLGAVFFITAKLGFEFKRANLRRCT